VTLRVAETTFEPRYKDRALIFPVRLGPRETARVRLEVKPAFEAPGVLPDVAAVRNARAELLAQIPRLVSSNHVVARAWDTATRDLATLPLGDAAGPAAAIAGIPLYQQLFGRDTLTTAWQALGAMPAMMRDALNVNAAHVGTKVDDWFDEEPGKLIHQATRGPLAALGATNNLRNYGDYATPPDFLIMLGQYLAWTDDRATVRKLLPVAREVVDWIDRYGDLDDDGLIEYVRWGAIGRLGLIKNLPTLYDGTHIQHPLAERNAVRRVDFYLDAPVDVMVDGEVLTLQCQRVDVLPAALNVVV